MTSPLEWAERGREIGATLDGCCAVVIAGADPTATAEVALGAARVQAMKRRVAVGDLIGEVPTFQGLVFSNDPHGLADSFEFGVSLNKIAHAVPDSGELFVLPSGTTPIDYEELFASERWKRLASGFREVGALLILAAPVDARNLRQLVNSTDGLIIVGDEVPTEIPVVRALAWLKPRRATRPSVAAEAPLAAAGAVRSRIAPPRRKIPAGWIAGGAITIALGLAGLWFAQRPFAADPRTPGAKGGSALGTGVETDSATLARAESLKSVHDAARAAAAARLDSTSTLLTVTNAADSALASSWAVLLEETNNKAGAILDLRVQFETVPAGTFAVDERSMFLLVSGAFASRAGAESLLVQLRGRKVLAPTSGTVKSLPYAFLVQADVPAADVPKRLSGFASRAQPVYALRQSNGSAHLYFGAFESVRQAALAVPTVREAGLTPTLVFRTGRVF